MNTRNSKKYANMNQPISTSHKDDTDDNCNFDSYSDNYDSDSSKRKPRSKLYWTREKRNIIHEVFQEEIANRSLRVSQIKIKKAIGRLKEKKGRTTEARIRTIVHRLRNELTENTNSGDESSRASYWTEKRRRIVKTILYDEIQDRSVPLTSDKIREALVEMRETIVPRNELRVRNFIYKLRAQEKVKIEGVASVDQSEEKCRSVVVDIEVYQHYLKCNLVNMKSGKEENENFFTCS